MQRNKNNYWNLYVKNSEFDFYRDNIFLNNNDTIQVNKDIHVYHSVAIENYKKDCNVALNFDPNKNTARIRVGGAGQGASNGFEIQSPGDYVEMKVGYGGSGIYTRGLHPFNNDSHDIGKNDVRWRKNYSNELVTKKILFDIERAWAFESVDTGSNTKLYLTCQSNEKSFRISNYEKTKFADFHSTSDYINFTIDGSITSSGHYKANVANGEKHFGFYNGSTPVIYLYGNNSGRIGMWDALNGRSVFHYNFNNSSPYYAFKCHAIPDGNNTYTCGSSSNRWSTVYAVNALNTSDERYKENIEYVDTKRNDETKELHEFYKNDFKLATYNYVGQEHKEYGFIAQDFANSNIGRNLVVNNEEGYMYSIGSYISSIAGALQHEIKLRDKQIEELMERISRLENFSN